MNKKLKTFLCYCLLFALVVSFNPLGVFAQDDIETTEYSNILGSTGWTKSARIWQEWETGSGKALGVYRTNGGLVKATQGTTAPDGAAAVKFTFTEGDTNAYMLFASKNRASEDTSIYVPNTEDVGYLEFDIYTTGDSLVSMNFNPQMYDGGWPNMIYNFEALSKNEWHTVRVPFDECVFSNSKYTWKDAKAFDQLKFYVSETVPEDTDIYIKNMKVMSGRMKTKLTVDDSGVLADGTSFVKVSFSRDVILDTVSEDVFSIDGFTCTQIVKTDDRTLKLIFDGELECPQTYMLSVSDGIIDIDGKKVSSGSFEFLTKLREGTTAEVTGSGIAGTGKFFVDVAFSRAIKANSVECSQFIIDGFECIDIQNIDEYSIRLIFDGSISFPDTYTLEIGEGILDEEEYFVESTGLDFTTKDYGATEIDTVDYNVIIRPSGWTNSSIIWQEWETGAGKALGVANKYGGSDAPLQKAVQASLDPVSGEENSVKFPVKSGNSNAFLLFASREHGNESKSMRIPYEADMAYLEFEIYTTNVSPNQIWLGIKTVAPVNWPNFTYDFESELKANTWHKFIIPFESFESNNVKYTWKEAAAIDSLRFMLPARVEEDSDIYIKNLKITQLRSKTEAKITSSGMNEKGHAFIDLSFDRSIDTSSVNSNMFFVDGLDCIEIYAIDDKNFRIIFDGQFEFPKTYTLYITDGVVDAEGFDVNSSSVEFTTKDYSDDIYVSSLTIDESAVSSGTVRVNADVKTICEKDNIAPSIKMIAVAYNGDEMVAYSESEVIPSLERGDSSEIGLTLISDKIKLENEIVVFFVSAKDGIRPLCTALHENK